MLEHYESPVSTVTTQHISEFLGGFLFLSAFLFDVTFLHNGHSVSLDISDSATLSLDIRETCSYQFVSLVYGHCGPLSPYTCSRLRTGDAN